MPLTIDQRKYLEQRLRDERQRALDLVERVVADRSRIPTREQSGDLSEVPFHPADLGTDTIDEELDTSNATRASLELKEIDAALERLYENPDQFGICEDTGKEIPFERLDLVPWARKCEERSDSSTV